MRSKRTLKAIVPVITAILLVAAPLGGCHLPGRKSRVMARADRYFKAGEYDKAKIEYLNSLRLDEQNVTAFQQLGFIWYEQGDPLRAIPFLLRARELAPKNVAVRAKLALSLMAIGQSTEARKEAVSILQQEAGNPDAIILLADTSLTKDEIAATDQQLQKFPQKDSAVFHLASASLALQRGDTATASDQVRQALTSEPASYRTHSAMAHIYLLQKDLNGALHEFKTAAKLAPLRSNEWINYAEFQAATGAIDEAKASLQNITRQAPDYLPAWRLLAQIAFNQKNYDESLSLLENILSRDPDNPEARMLQSEVWLAKGDSGKAVAILDRLDSTYPNIPLIKFRLARAYLSAKNISQAESALQQAIAANPNYTEAILALGELNLRSGKPQAVAAAMADLLKKRPGLLQASLMLADAYQVLGRRDDATALLREQIKITPLSFEAYYLLGLILQRQGKTDEARRAFEEASEVAPDNLDPINQLVGMDLAEKQYDAATKRVQRQLQRKPDAAGTHFLEARIYAAQQDWPRAEAALRKTLELNADLAPAYDLLVSVFLAANKLPQAIAELETLLKKNPTNAVALMIEALVYDKMNDYQKARDTYEKLLALNPDTVPALNNLAYLYAEHLNQLDRAYELAEKAHTLKPNEAEIADTLGWILYRRGDYQQALVLLQESANKLPENPEVQFHLGMTSYMMDQADKARSAFEQALHATADFPDKNEAQRQLALLKESPGGKTELPVTELEALLKRQPNDPIVLNRLAAAYEKQGETAKAAASYEQALKLNPKLLSANLELAQLYAGPLAKHDRALEIAKKARQLAPNDAHVAGVLGRIAFQLDNFSWAYSLLQESVRQLADDPTVLHDYAWAAYSLGKVSQARELMERALKAAPAPVISEDAKAFLRMTAVDENPKDAAALGPEVQKSLKANPNYVPALTVRAGIEEQRGEAKAAIATYSAILQRFPDFAPAQRQLAALYLEDPGALDQAYDMAVKARKTLPDDPALAQTLGEISFQKKDYGRALQLLQESGRKNPLDAKGLYYTGMSHLQLKQKPQAKEALERALAAGLQEPLASEAKRGLAESKAK
jgi:tetratricopeptide (TPR) repeat protein